MEKKCPLIVAREYIGSHFSRDYDDDEDADMVTINGRQFSGTGCIQFYITCRLLDNARNEIRGLNADEYASVLHDYYPFVDATVKNIVTFAQLKDNAIEQSGVAALVRKQLSILYDTIRSIEARERLLKLAAKNTTIADEMPLEPPGPDPAALREWLQSVASWMSTHEFIVPKFSRRIPAVPAIADMPLGPLKDPEDYKTALADLLKIEVDVCKYLSKVENFYIYISNYINDVLDVCRDK